MHLPRRNVEIVVVVARGSEVIGIAPHQMPPPTPLGMTPPGSTGMVASFSFSISRQSGRDDEFALHFNDRASADGVAVIDVMLPTTVEGKEAKATAMGWPVVGVRVYVTSAPRPRTP